METISSLFKYLVDPVCLIDKKQGEIAMGNRPFEVFTGYDAKCLASMPLDDIVYKRDFKNIWRRLSHMGKEQHLRDEIRLLSKDRVLKEAEVTICEIKLRKRILYMCSFRDISSQKDMERELRDRLAKEEGKVTETARGILRVKRLLEKLHFLPTFSGELAKCVSEAQLLQKAVRLMCHRSGFRYAEATVFLVEGKYLKLASSSKECALQKFHMEKQHRFAQVARNEKKIVADSRGEFVIPIENAGILQVILEESERVLVAENEYIKKAHLDLLESLAQMLAISLAHSRMVRENELRCREDPETGLSNREYFVKHLRQRLQEKRSLSLFLMELDQSHIEGINGDIQLKEVADTLSSCVPNNGILGRVGGDAFAIATEHENLKEASTWIDQVKRKMIRKFSGANPDCRLTFSAGVTLHKGIKKKSASALWKQAFSCLKTAKNEGGDKIFYWQQRPREFVRSVTSKLM